ncbi:hypothetical protein MLD38_031991 [Melastoma candidum]|uniref:Uncharacterized protein n=1 Tax=Melastoma candidum TaxID=119954 RepID=A0ACB9MRF2_9MYRT|nr:hypothetical protein MLD38_031991 [Melastoma candidum]
MRSSSMDLESSHSVSAVELEEEEESQHSPLRFHSPLPSYLGDPVDTPPYFSPMEFPDNYMKDSDDSSWRVSVSASMDKFTRWSPLHSLSPDSGKVTEETNSVETMDTPLPVVVVNKAVRLERMHPMTKVGPNVVGGGGVSAETVFKRSRGGDVALKTSLWFRVMEVILCLISFSVMAADKTQGWSGDSFDRYKEYRYCLSVNVIAFLYSSAQACDLACQLMTGNRFVCDYIHDYFDFFMDQILAYLLVSASSSAATRVDDWIANWGSDKFTEMASASVAMAFLAFSAFAVSALISGYNFCTPLN